MYFRDLYSHPLTRLSGTYGWETQVGWERLAVLCHKFLIDLFYGFIFYLFGQGEILISGNLGFKACVLFSGWSMCLQDMWDFPKHSNPVESQPLAQAGLTLMVLDKLVALLLEEISKWKSIWKNLNIWHNLACLNPRFFFWYKLLKFYHFLPNKKTDLLKWAIMRV